MLINIQPLMRSSEPYWVQIDEVTPLESCDRWDSYERNFCVGTAEGFGVRVSPADVKVNNGIYEDYDWGAGKEWGVLYETVQNGSELKAIPLSLEKMESVLKRKGYNPMRKEIA